MTRFLSLAAALVLTATAFAPFAYAGSPADTVDVQTQRVAVRSADLSLPAGQAEARARIASTARSVCGNDDLRDLAQHNDYKACVAAAQADALAHLDTMIARGASHDVFAQAAKPNF